MDSTTLRIILILAGIGVLALIYLTYRPRAAASQRRKARAAEPRLDGSEVGAGVSDQHPGEPADEHIEQLGLLLDEELRQGQSVGQPVHASGPGGERLPRAFERLVVLHLAAREGRMLAGSDIVVSAEKAGLHFAEPGIYFRSVDGSAGGASVFCLVNAIKPGHLDMRAVDSLRTPGLSLILALPAPLAALDAWDMMLPTAQRLGELLDAQVLDEDRNPLGRQGIAHQRDLLRRYDRERDPVGLG